MDEKNLKIVRSYLFQSYKETLRLQIWLSDYGIPFSYTDTLSQSELKFLFDTDVEYVKEKNDAAQS